MATFLFANNATSTLAAPVAPGAATITLSAGAGTLFPNPSPGQQFALTLNDAATGVLTEICYCTARAGDVLTVARAQEGTLAQSWLAGDLASNFVTAGQMAAMVQVAGLYPTRIVQNSGVFVMTNADANGGVGLQRVVGPGPSQTTLPATAVPGQSYAVEDLVGNFNPYPVSVAAPVGHLITNEPSILLNINRQCAYFRYYGSNAWSVKL